MKHIISAIALICLFGGTAVAQTATIKDTIQGQFHAFQTHDPNAAFEFASPTIQQKFANPQQFAQMVERGFPMVWNSGEIRFLERREINGLIWQKVMVQDATGRLHMLDYQMVNDNNVWKINGVQILPSPDIGA